MGRRRSQFARAVLVLGLAAPLVMTSGSPAFAACPVPGFPDADGRVRLTGGGNFQGINVYNLTGANQNVTINGVPPGASGEFVVKYRNRSDKARGISVRGQVPKAVSFRIKYFLGDQNITTEMSVNGLKFTGIPPGKSTPALTVRIKVRNNAQNNDDIQVFVQGSYGNDPTCGDTVFAGVVAFS